MIRLYSLHYSNRLIYPNDVYNDYVIQERFVSKKRIQLIINLFSYLFSIPQSDIYKTQDASLIPRDYNPSIYNATDDRAGVMRDVVHEMNEESGTVRSLGTKSNINVDIYL